jgi:hypothetical protein
MAPLLRDGYPPADTLMGDALWDDGTDLVDRQWV